MLVCPVPLPFQLVSQMHYPPRGLSCLCPTPKGSLLQVRYPWAPGFQDSRIPLGPPCLCFLGYSLEEALRSGLCSRAQNSTPGPLGGPLRPVALPAPLPTCSLLS